MYILAHLNFQQPWKVVTILQIEKWSSVLAVAEFNLKLRSEGLESPVCLFFCFFISTSAAISSSSSSLFLPHSIIYEESISGGKVVSGSRELDASSTYVQRHLCL